MSIQAVAWVLEHSESRGMARLVLISLANHHNGGTGQCNPGQRLIADEAKVSKTAARRALERLVELGELEILDPGDNRRAARYRLPFVKSGPQGTAERGPKRTAEVTPDETAAVPPEGTRTARNRKEPEVKAAAVEAVRPNPYNLPAPRQAQSATAAMADARKLVGKGRAARGESDA